jgi:hypothetical protein
MEAKMPTKLKEAYKRKEEEIIPVPTLLCVHDGYNEVSAPYFRQRLVKKVYHKRNPISAVSSTTSNSYNLTPSIHSNIQPASDDIDFG